jgi:hypothetical protein
MAESAQNYVIGFVVMRVFRTIFHEGRHYDYLNFCIENERGIHTGYVSERHKENILVFEDIKSAEKAAEMAKKNWPLCDILVVPYIKHYKYKSDDGTLKIVSEEVQLPQEEYLTFNKR